MIEPIFYFDHYKVRPVQESDRAYIDTLTSADPYHAGCMNADWFIHLVPGEDAWAIEDERGEVLLYFKTQTAVRLSLQFASNDNLVNRNVLARGMSWIEAMLVRNHFREIIFDTQGPALKALAKRRLGFTETTGVLVRGLPCLSELEGSKDGWTVVPTGEGEGYVRKQ